MVRFPMERPCYAWSLYHPTVPAKRSQHCLLPSNLTISSGTSHIKSRNGYNTDNSDARASKQIYEVLQTLTNLKSSINSDAWASDY